MKRFSYAALLLVLLLALLPGAALAHTCDAPASYPLYAGQTIPVGYVTVCNDVNNLTVTYDTSSSGWLISETHLAASTVFKNIPQTKTGNPIPGQFPYGGSFNPPVTTATYTIPKSAIGSPAVGATLYIAAHAVVWDPNSATVSGTVQVCSDGNESYTAYNNFVLGDDAGNLTGNAPVRSGTAKPSAEPYGEQTDAANSAWDDGVGAPFTGGNACADWIWEDNFGNPIAGLNQAVNPINGDRVEFRDNFNLPPAFSYSGMLYASSDNAYEAYVNTTTPGAPLISGQTGAGWWESDLRESFVNTNGWQSVESAPLTGLVQGANFLFFRAANEYMNVDDGGGNNLPGNTPASSQVGSPYIFVPEAYINPAGMIWLAEIDYYNLTNDETAWAAQGEPGSIQFLPGNWATYITYTWQ
jgi:hypothetical protein